MAGGSLQGIYLKLDRAEEHLNALHAEITAFIEAHPITPGGNFDPVADCWVFRVGQVEPLPARWGVIVGDIAHNVRSSLDHLVNQLVIANGRTPGRHTSFPVCLTQSDWNRTVINAKRGKSPLQGVADGAASLIESIQPFNVPAPYEPKRTTLAGINAIWNADKHRLVHTARSYTTEGEPRITLDPPPPMTKVVWARYSTLTEIAEGAEVARAQLAAHQLAVISEMGISLELNVTIGFQELPGGPVAPMRFLAHTVSEVRKTMSCFERFM